MRRVTGSVLGDESLFDSLRGGPDSGYGVSEWVGPLSALSFNRGLARENGSAFQRTAAGVRREEAEASALKRIGDPDRGVGAASARRAPEPRRSPRVESITVGRLMQVDQPDLGQLLRRDARQAPRRHPRPSRARRPAARRPPSASRAASAPARTSSTARASRAANRAAPRAVVRLLRGMYAAPRVRAVLRLPRPRPASAGTLSEREHEPPLPGQDRHDQRRQRPVGLLPGRLGRPDRVLVPDERRRLRLRRAPAASRTR